MSGSSSEREIGVCDAQWRGLWRWDDLKAALVLSAEQRAQLESMASSRSLPAGLVTRVRIVLLSAAGKMTRQIATIGIDQRHGGQVAAALRGTGRGGAA